MTDPSRWLDDAETPPELRDLLKSAERPLELDSMTRARLGSRVARLAVPVSLVTWLSVKSAAAIGVAAGIVTAGTGLGISAYVEKQERVEQSAQVAAAPPARRNRGTPESVEPQTLTPAPSPSAPEPEAPQAPAATTAPARPGGLAEESLLLERARRALNGQPAQALTLVREHATRFPRGQLASERNLVELEALHRLGRHGEARALAERLLAAGGDDLYRARIQRLLEKIAVGH